MKKILSLVLAFALAFTLVVVPVSAEGTPTATVVAYTDATNPAVGEMFFVTFGLENVSTNALRGGQIAWTWPADVASLADSYFGTPITNVDDVETYCYHLGEYINPYTPAVRPNPATGKFEPTASSSTDLEAGYTALALTMAQAAPSKDVETTTDGTFKLFTVAYVLNEGYTMEDFYVELGTSRFMLDLEDDLLASTDAAGDLTLESRVTKKEDVIYMNSVHQPGVNNGDVDGVYELPEVLTEGRTYEVYLTLETSGTQGDNTLVALNNAAQMSASNYFTNSTIMMKFDGNTDIMVRNGANTTKVGSLSNAATTVDVKYTVDLINKTWGVTVTENGAVTVEQSGLAFRDTGAHLPIDALVLADNDSRPECFWVNADSIKIIDTTPASVGDVVFNYVTADGTVLETATMSGETGATVEVAAKTITDANGVKYEAPAASGVVGTDAEVTVTCAKVEVVTISYTVAGVEVATATVEGVAGAEVAYNSGNVATATGLYAKSGTIVVDAENLTVAVELDAVAEGLVSAAGQSVEGINTLEKQMTTAGTVTFDLTVINPKDTLVALDNAVAVQAGAPKVNYFANSSAYIQLKDGSFQMNDGNGAQSVAAYEVGKTYSVEFVLDVTGKTYTVTVMDGETEVLKQEGFGMRNATIDVIDSLVIVDNAGAGVGAVVVSNLVVETDDEQPTEEVPSEDESEEPSDEEPEVPSDEEPEVPSDEEPEVPSDEEPEVPSDEEPEVPSDEEPEVPSDEEPEVPSDEEPEVPSDEEPEVPSDEEPEVPSDEEPEVPSDEEPEVPSDEESEVPSDEEPEVPSDEEPEVPSDEEPEVPSDEEPEVPSDEEPEVPSDEEPEVPSDEEPEEPSEEPGEEVELPYEAVDVVVTPSALGVTISGKFVLVDEEYEATESVVVVISYFKDGKAYSVQAVKVYVKDGEVEIPPSNVTLTEGELTVAGISVLTGVDALTAITTGNLGTPVGVWK